MGIVKWLPINVACMLLLNADLLKAQTPAGYDLVWADEFDGNALDTSQWKYRIGESGTSYQRAENVVIENGKAKINLKKESYRGKVFTGGGIITTTPRRYGYYEVSVKIDGGYGWHEAFWTSWMSGFENKNPAYKAMGKLEIDCFEHYAEYDNHYLTYGAIEWSPVKGNVNRDYLTVKEDLNASYSVFGFEFTPDYLNYYYNGKLLKTVDIRGRPKHDLYLWLSCIAKKPDATESGAVYFDYLRCYEISPENYALRKTRFIK